MNPIQNLTPLGSWQWVNLVNAPPLYGQREYSLVLRRNIASKGINSPPFMELLIDVSQQFTRFAFRA